MKDDTIIYSHSVEKESEAQTSQVPRRKWRNHNLRPGTGARGLHLSALPLSSRRVSGSNAAEVAGGLGETGVPTTPWEQCHICLPVGLFCLQCSQPGLLWGPRPWGRGVDCEVAIIALVSGDFGAIMSSWNISPVPTGYHISWRSVS